MVDVKGKRFSRWLVLRKAPRCSSSKRLKWVCVCDCGVKKNVNSTYLRNGMSRSCGCLQRELAAKNQFRHGGYSTPEYSVWVSMKQRCNNSKYAEFHLYGGRGIKVCSRWKLFKNFYEDMGPRPSKKHQIDRIDNNGHYSPKNCRWVTCIENQKNKRTNVIIEINGVSKILADWCRVSGLTHTCLWWRVKKGCPPSDLLRPSGYWAEDRRKVPWRSQP